MERPIREAEVGDHVLAVVSHVTDDGTGIVGRNGKLHVPDCDRAGRPLSLRITSVEEGYVVGEPASPPDDEDVSLFVQRASDATDPESDQLTAVDREEWRRRLFAYRLHWLFPAPLADRYPPQSLTLGNVRSTVAPFAALLGAVAVLYAAFVAVTAGLDALGALGAFAERHPDVAPVVLVLGVVGLANAYFGATLVELYVKVAGALAGLGVGAGVGATVAPAFAAIPAGLEGPAFGRFMVAMMFGFLPIALAASIGAGVGAAIAPVLHRVSILAGGFTAFAYPTYVLVAGASVGVNPLTGGLLGAPVALALAIVAGLVGVLVAAYVYVLSVVVLTAGLGAALVAGGVSLAHLAASGAGSPTVADVLGTGVGFAAPFALLFLTGVAVQLRLIRLDPEIEDDGAAWRTPGSREDWQPPDV